MMIKNVKLEWYILQHDFNSDKIKMQDVLYVIEPKEIIKKIKKGKKETYLPIIDYKTFKEYIKRKLMYYFWSKAEREFIAKGMFEEDKKYKIDGWFQLEPNLDRICQYIINEMELKI